MEKHILILYSGGLDSLIMEQYAKINYPNSKINKVWFDIGQEYNYKEKAALPADVEIKKVDWHAQTFSKNEGETGSGNIFIPGRNAVFALLGASMYLPDEIWLGALNGETHDNATDKNNTFLTKINNLISYVYSPFKKEIKVRFPLVDANFGKYEAVEWGLQNGLTIEQIKHTSSCLSGEEGNCGKCVVCIRRWGIFKQLGFNEKYNVHPLETIESKLYFKSILEGKYDKWRMKEIIGALELHYHTTNINQIKKYIYEQ